MISYNNLFAKTIDGKMIRLSLDEQGIVRNFMLIETPEAKRFAGFSLMNKDIELVLESITLMVDSSNSLIIQQSLMFFAIVTYAKCFTTNEGTRPSLNFDNVFKDATQSIKDEHLRIMNLRNGYIAHAGNEFDHCHVVGTVVASTGIDVNCQLSHVVSMTTKLEDFKSLCLYIQTEIRKKSGKAFQKVIENISNIYESEMSNLICQVDKDEIYTMTESKFVRTSL